MSTQAINSVVKIPLTEQLNPEALGNYILNNVSKDSTISVEVVSSGGYPDMGNRFALVFTTKI